MEMEEKKKFRLDERAVSTALGFVLITSILFTAFGILVATQVPVWTKEFEAEHASKVPQDFAELASTIDMAILRADTSATGSCAIGMIPKAVPLLGIHASGGALHFEPDGTTTFVIACAPSADGVVHGCGSWNSTSSEFSIYDKYHVTVIPTGARLNLSKEADKIYNTGEEEYLSGNYWFDEFVVTNNTTVVTSTLTIHAQTITVDAGSRITADGMGGAGGASEQDGTGPDDGYGKGATADSAGGGGAGYGGHGGAGGDYNSNGGGGANGTSYGNNDTMTIEVGSGGGGGGIGYGERWRHGQWKLQNLSGGHGGNGGGYIWLEAQNITINGTISANGSDGENGASGRWSGGASGWSATGGGGGGSGGCIMIKGLNVTISDSARLYAVGGDGGDGGYISKWKSGEYINISIGAGGGGGAGGRIKVFSYYNDTPDINSYASALNGSGGSGCGEPDEGEDGEDGEPGTLYQSPPVAFTIRYPHYSYGYLTSNATNLPAPGGGNIGYNTTSTTTTRYGIITWDADTEPGMTSVVMKVRTSINENMSDAMDWDDPNFVPATNGSDISDLPSVADSHRYIQWRAELSTNDPYKTPLLRAVNISYEYGGGITPALVNSTGKIEFRSQYLYLPNYRLVYEHGAIIKNQTEGEIMLHAPPFSVCTDENGNISLKINAINLTGADSSVSGAFSTTVKASFVDSHLLTGGLNFLNLTLFVTTEYPGAWMKWFNETCKEASLEYGSDPGNYYINETGNTLQIVFFGDETRPVNLWLKEAEVDVGVAK